MNYIRVRNIVINNKRLEIVYEISLGLHQYFDEKQNIFWIEYTEDISTVPPSIAVIPFVCNVLPIIWLSNSRLILPELDKNFYDSIEEFKKGYIDMYPMFSFEGLLDIDHIVDNSYLPNGGNAAFFSGGVDAFTTLICHREEKPTLITLRGSDIKLDDIEGWSNVTKHLYSTVLDFQLPNPVCIVSNFRSFINEGTLSWFVKDSNDGWWHGFQCGIGLIAQVAPIAYIKRLYIVYIASSYTLNDRIPSASYPTIDNHIRFGNCRVVHDQYEHHRQEKIRILTEYCRNTHNTINLRVCWISRGGKNCCHCEKCLRTILALMAEGENPHDYGFDYTNEDLQNSKTIIINNLYNSNDGVKHDWLHITERFIETGAYKYDERINWVYKLNPYANRPAPSLYQRIRRKLGRIIRELGLR